MKIRIYYEDTDAGGIVYHTNYLKYCERARSELFFAHDAMPFEGDRSGFVVRRIESDFIGSARLGDCVNVTTRIAEIKRSIVTLDQAIDKEGACIFRMKIMLVYLKNGKPSKIPPHFIKIFESTR